MPQKFTRNNFVSPNPEPSEVEALDTAKRTVVVELSPDVLVDGVGQTRTDYIQETLEEFADSIKAEGIIEPLIVERLPSGLFGILAGHRRKRAAVLAGLPTVPCIVHAPFKSDKDRVIFGIIENVIREDISPMDKANAYKRLVDEGMNHSEIARRIGVQQSSVSRALRLLELPETIQDAVSERTITPKKLRSVMPHINKPGVADAVVAAIRNGDTSEKRMTEIVQSVMQKTVSPKSSIDVTGLVETMGRMISYWDRNVGNFQREKFSDYMREIKIFYEDCEQLMTEPAGEKMFVVMVQERELI